jgi:pimeloyl-ACP methyl ester carboxylesterase
LPLDLAFRRLGDGPAVLVLHGLLGQSRNWQAIARRLQRSLGIFLVDLRNHGASPWSAEVGFAAMADDLVALVQRERLGRVALVGHSLGGKVAMTLALRRPDLVQRLAVVDIAPVAYRSGFEDLIRAMLAVELGPDTRRADVEAALTAGVPDANVRAFLATNLQTRAGRLAWAPNLEALLAGMEELKGFPPPPDPGRYDGPTLFLRGGLSRYVRPEHEPTILRLFPQARIVTVEGAGHWVHAEKPERTITELERFLLADG